MTTDAVGGAPAGAPGGTGQGPTGATPAPTTQAPTEAHQPELSREQRMMETIRRQREPDYGARDPAGRFARDPSAQPATASGEQEPAGERQPDAGQGDDVEAEASQDADATRDAEPKEQPKWLARRLERERERVAAPLRQQTEALQGQLHETRVEARRAQAALRLMAAELERAQQARRDGLPHDPRDDEVTSLRLQQEAQRERARIDGESQQERQARVEEQEHAQLVDRIGTEVERELSARTLVARPVLIAALLADQGRSSVAAVAARVEAEEQRRLASLGYAPQAARGAPQAGAPTHQPRTPTTARTSSPPSGGGYDGTDQGKLRTIARYKNNGY